MNTLFGAGKWLSPGMLGMGGLLGGQGSGSYTPFNQLPGIGVSPSQAFPIPAPYFPAPKATPAPAAAADPNDPAQWQSRVRNNQISQPMMTPDQLTYYFSLRGYGPKAYDGGEGR